MPLDANRLGIVCARGKVVDHELEALGQRIGHTQQVRAAESLGEYCRLFRLYLSAPGAAQHVMDTFVDEARLEAVKTILKGYAPSVPLPFVARNLGFEEDEDAAFFLEDHGCVLLLPEKTSVDCKQSRASLVEHSIAAKLEEERKDAQRKAEIIPITFS